MAAGFGHSISRFGSGHPARRRGLLASILAVLGLNQGDEELSSYTRSSASS